MVAPYMVHPHEGGWSVDVSARKMEGKDNRPFVRLVVVRYQPQSVPGWSCPRSCVARWCRSCPTAP